VTDTERTTDDVNLRCKSCHHIWTFAAPRGVTVPQWIASIEQPCPACGVGYVLTSKQEPVAPGSRPGETAE
jgi:hypothetical protein